MTIVVLKHTSSDLRSARIHCHQENMFLIDAAMISSQCTHIPARHLAIIQTSIGRIDTLCSQLLIFKSSDPDHSSRSYQRHARSGTSTLSGDRLGLQHCRRRDMMITSKHSEHVLTASTNVLLFWIRIDELYCFCEVMSFPRACRRPERVTALPSRYCCHMSSARIGSTVHTPRRSCLSSTEYCAQWCWERVSLRGRSDGSRINDHGRRT